jgi:hypothetical protein
VGRLSFWAAGALIALTLGACTLSYKQPELSELYDRPAQYHGPERRAIIVIPGILGSKLLEAGTDRVVWGAFSGGYAKPNQPDGAQLVAHPMGEGAPLVELRDSVYASDVLDRIKVRIAALPMTLKAYFHMIEVLGAGGYQDENLGLSGAVDYGDDHFTCFQFPYDFRRDNVENAKRLHEFILEKRQFVQQKLEERFGIAGADVKFDIVAHSMGGLLTRYYLRYGDADLGEDGPLPPIDWAGSRYVERVVLVAPPNAGSAEALINLVEGRKFAPLLPRYRAALLGTFPSMYQLLPRSRHASAVWAEPGSPPVEDVLDPALWREMEWGLASPDAEADLAMMLPDVADSAERRRIGLDHLDKSLARARRFAEALDRPAAPPAGVSLYLIAGDVVPTVQQVAIDRGDGGLSVSRRGPGDGSVLRSSAMMDERVGGTWSPGLRSPIAWERTMMLFTNHLGLTKDPIFTDNVLYWLLEEPREAPARSAGPG